MVPRENHQKNIRSLIEKSEFVPQMKAIIVYCLDWSLLLRCNVKLKK